MPASTIVTVLGALAQLVASWVAPKNVENDIADGVALLTAAGNVDPNLAIATTALKVLGVESAEYANLKDGQIALVGTVGASFDGQADKVVLVAFRQSSEVAAKLGL